MKDPKDDHTEASFRPTAARLEEIARLGAKLLAEADEDSLASFTEVEDEKISEAGSKEGGEETIG